MLRGSKPGEHRGGRKRNTPNKRTVLVDRILAIGLEHSSLSPQGLLLKVVKDPKLPADTRMAVVPQSFPLKKTLEANHTTGAEQQKTKVTPAAIRSIGHLSATFDICVMRISRPCRAGVHGTDYSAFVVEIEGMVRRTDGTLRIA